MKKLNVAVIGQGYVGLPLAVAAAQAGHYVVGYDTNESLVRDLKVGKSRIEDVTGKMLEEVIESGNYLASSWFPMANVAPADVYVVTVPTPLDEQGHPDLSYVIDAAETIATQIGPNALVVLESTVAPGTTEGVFLDAINRKRIVAAVPGANMHLAFSPERIDPGNLVWDFSSTPKLVGGATSRCTKMAFEFYSSFVNQVHITPTIRVAETAKLLENTFRHVKIALVNELAQHCHEIGVDVWDVIEAASTKPYGFMAFYPGPGVGGHCLPVDPAYLGQMVKSVTGNDFHFIDLAMRINSAQPMYVVRRAQDILNQQGKAMRKSRILLVGYSYKPDTADSRETPATGVWDGLDGLGAVVDVLDPYLPTADFKDVESISQSAFDQFDLIVMITPHAVFDLDKLANSGVPILDTRDAFAVHNPRNVHKL